MNQNTKSLKIIKLILFILAIALIIGLSIYLFPLFSKLGTPEGQQNFKSEINNSGFKGPFTILGLQLLQILIPVLPGEPIEFLAGMCYGTLGGMVLIFLGAFISSSIILFLVQKLGRNFIYTFLGKDKVQKLENSKLFSNPTKLEIFFLLAFLIPGTPKDLFVYIAGLLPIRKSRFLLISTFARFPSVISSTFAGANVVNGNLWLTVTAYIVTFFISIIGIYVYNLIEKNNL